MVPITRLNELGSSKHCGNCCSPTAYDKHS